MASAEHNLTSNSQSPHRVPQASSLSKRTKRKPRKFEGFETDVHMERPKISSALSDPSSSCLSLREEKSPTKGFKIPAPSSPAMIRAVEFQNSLGTEFPSCIKMMSLSQVSSGFWMHLPQQFCRSYLPKKDATYVLEGENGVQCEVKYIAYKYGLSKGWKSFVLKHKLNEDDILVFQLVETNKFKVYILKANDSSEKGHALSLNNLEAQTEQATAVTASPKTKKNKHPESLSSTVSQKKHKKSVLSTSSVPPSGQHIKISGNSSEEGGPEPLECSRPSKPYLFQDVKSFQDFHIMVKGVCIDHELPDDVRMGYYKLCIYKKEFLHEDLPKGLYDTLVPGMIGQTVSIVNEMKGCKITATKEDFDRWDNSLVSFELLGMKVGFLRDKIRELVALVFQSEGAVDIKQYVEALNESKRSEDEIKKVEARLKELKEMAEKSDRIVGCLKPKVEKYEYKFEEEVNGLW